MTHDNSFVERARNDLANKTWPAVLGVIEYQSSQAPLTPDAEFEELEKAFEAAGYPHIATFVSFVQLREKQTKAASSFVLNVCRRRMVGKTVVIDESSAAPAATPHLPVGKRNATDSAAQWFRKLLDDLPRSTPEHWQILNEVFGEALAFLGPYTESVPLSEFVGDFVLAQQARHEALMRMVGNIN